MKTTTDTQLTDDRRNDMLVGALEGGSNYWYEFREDACAIISKNFQGNRATPFVDRLFEVIKNGAAIQVHDIETGALLGELTTHGIDEGERIMQEKYPEHWADIISGNDDATTADVWFQLCVMKEIVYG